MVYCFDLDGTLCSNTDGDYVAAQPLPDVIAAVNLLHDAGHEITIFTARGSTTGIDWRDATRVQLDSWGVKHDRLLFGKPYADVYVDDKAVSPALWMQATGSRA